MIDSDSDSDDSGSEFFGSSKLHRTGSSGSSSCSDSDTVSQESELGLVQHLQQQIQQRNAPSSASVAATRLPIVMKMATPTPQVAADVTQPPVQLVGYAVPTSERDPEGPPHICAKCKLPIAIYGKLVSLQSLMFDVLKR